MGQVTIEYLDKPELLTDKDLFEGWIERKKNKTKLLSILDNAKSEISIQLLNLPKWCDREDNKSLAPLQDWLLDNLEGMLYVEGGEFYDRDGLIE